MEEQKVGYVSNSIHTKGIGVLQQEIAIEILKKSIQVEVILITHHMM